MRTIFRQELEGLGDNLTQMTRKVHEAVTIAGEALREANIEKAERVIDADNRIDEIEDAIEDVCLSLLARQQPVATDLRLVVSAMRLSATLERMGDLARHVAFIARSSFPGHAASGRLLDTLSQMTEAATSISGMLADLLDNHDLDLAQQIRTSDDELDRLLRDVFDILASDDEMTRAQVVDAVLLSRFLERIGDHSVSGADRIAYLVTGDLDRSALHLPESPEHTTD